MFGTTKLSYRCLTFFIFFAEAIFIDGYAQDRNTDGSSSIHTSIRSAQIVSPLSPADSAWNRRPQYPNDMGKSQMDMLVGTELYGRALRNWAINFYSTFPDDCRKEQAMLIAMDANVCYWEDPEAAAKTIINSKNYQNIKLIKEEISKWNSIFSTMKKEYLTSSRVSQKAKLDFKKRQIMTLLFGSKSWEGDKLDPNTVIQTFEQSVNAAKELNPSNIYDRANGGNVFLAIEGVFILRETYGWTLADVREFIGLAGKSSVTEIKEWAKRRLSLFQLQEHPLKIRHADINNNIIDLEDYKGKVVLIDFWATWCSSCIGGMKGIKRIYSKLHGEGFDVLSISINREEDREEVLKVKNQIGFSWPLLIIGGKKGDNASSLYRQLWTKYSLNSVPQLLLIDKNGLLIEYGGPLFNSKNLEKIINRYL